MLDRAEILFAFLSGWIVAGLAYKILKRKNAIRLPSGSIPVEIPGNSLEKNIPGPPWSRWLVIAGMGVGEFILVSLTVICILDFFITDLWYNISHFIAWDFPKWLNWLGISSIWLQMAWGTWVMLYNGNYTPANKPIQGQYVIATGGPYSIVKHPMYVAKAILSLFIFLATRIWFSLFGLITWIGLPNQAQSEENFFEERFGPLYSDYLARTGRFFPKRSKKNVENQIQEYSPS